MASRSVPPGYTVPPFPSLYNPIRPLPGEAKFLYFTKDAWRFTLYWTLLFYVGAHLSAAFCAVAIQFRSWRVVWTVPLLYTVVASLEGLLAGSVVGLV
jgi:hypothetical protein